jgi:LPS export ABC transporter protein LptC
LKLNLNIFVLLLTVLLFLAACNEDRTTVLPPDQQEVPGLRPDQICWNVEVAFIDSSITKAILHAKRAQVFTERNESLLDGGLTVDFFSEKTGNRMCVLTADSARIDDVTKNMIAKGNVHVVADSSNTSLRTPMLLWDNKNQKIYSTEFVQIDSPTENIQGWGFESDMYLKNYKIFKVKGVHR